MSARPEIIQLSVFLAILGWVAIPLHAAENWHPARPGMDRRLPRTSVESDHVPPRCQSRHAFPGVGGQRYLAPVGSAQSLIVLSYGPRPSGWYSGVFYWANPPVCSHCDVPAPWCDSACLPCAFCPPVFVVPPVIYYDPAAPILRDLGVLRSAVPRPMLNGPPGGSPDLPGFNERYSEVVTPNSGLQDLGQRQQSERPPTPSFVRATNPRQHQLAQRFIGFGDKLFREGQYRAAYFQYREAEKAAPDVADTYFRQAFALIATRQYSMAFEAFQKGLSLDGEWPTRGFQVAMLYGERDLDAKHHRAELAEALQQNPAHPELLFLLAVHLYCDDRVAEAREFFRQARTASSVAPLVSLFPAVD